jgi:hypothetical protein
MNKLNLIKREILFMSEFKNCYKYSDVCARIIGGGDLDTIGEMAIAETIYGGPDNFIIRKVYDFGEIGTWIANSYLADDSSHYCFDKNAQEWLTANEDWWTGKWGRETEKKASLDSRKTAHANYSIDHVIECLKKSPLYTAERIETIDCLYRLRDNGYSLVCWSTIKGWVAINYDVEDGNHADIKAFCYSDASILEECYNKGYFDE